MTSSFRRMMLARPDPTYIFRHDEDGSSNQAWYMYIYELLSLTYCSDDMNVKNGSMDAPVWLKLTARAFQSSTLLIIVMSVVLLCIESFPEFTNTPNKPINDLELFCALYFLTDIILNFLSPRKAKEFFGDVFTWIDILTVLPFFLELLVEEMNGVGVLLVFRIVRLIRVFRVLKLSKFNEEIVIVLRTIMKSGSAIRLLFFMFAILLVLLSSLVFFVEQQQCTFSSKDQAWIRDDGSISPFQSIPHSMWWCIVTLTTVGYGDAVPDGYTKVIGFAAISIGCIVLAFPTIILSSNFAREKILFDQAKRDKLKKVKRKLITMASLMSAFRAATSHASQLRTLTLPNNRQVRISQRKSGGKNAWMWMEYDGDVHVLRRTRIDATTMNVVVCPTGQLQDKPALLNILREDHDEFAELGSSQLFLKMPNYVVLNHNLKEIAPFATAGSHTCWDCSSALFPITVRTSTSDQMDDLEGTIDASFKITSIVQNEEPSNRIRSVAIYLFTFQQTSLMTFLKVCALNDLVGGYDEQLSVVTLADLRAEMRFVVPSLSSIRTAIRRGWELCNSDQLADQIVAKFVDMFPTGPLKLLANSHRIPLKEEIKCDENMEVVVFDRGILEMKTILCRVVMFLVKDIEGGGGQTGLSAKNSNGQLSSRNHNNQNNQSPSSHANSAQPSANKPTESVVSFADHV